MLKSVLNLMSTKQIVRFVKGSDIADITTVVVDKKDSSIVVHVLTNKKEKVEGSPTRNNHVYSCIITTHEGDLLETYGEYDLPLTIAVSDAVYNAGLHANEKYEELKNDKHLHTNY